MDLQKYICESADVKKKFIDNIDILQIIIQTCIDCFNKWNKILIACNGWSATDAQHRAAEFMGKYKLERLPVLAIWYFQYNCFCKWL